MTKYERISVLARETAKEICANREEWIRYLNVASRLLKQTGKTVTWKKVKGVKGYAIYYWRKYSENASCLHECI